MLFFHSKCSRSCGGTGVRARQLRCIWSVNGDSAGAQCYANQLPVPDVVEQCEAPPCKLSESPFHTLDPGFESLQID